MNIEKTKPRGRLLVNHPGENDDLYKDMEGFLITNINNSDTMFRVLVLFDICSEQAYGNDHYIEEYLHISQEDEKYDQYSGRLWWVESGNIEPITKNLFRKMHPGESVRNYKVCKKIHELDYHWRYTQNAKANNLSI